MSPIFYSFRFIILEDHFRDEVLIYALTCLIESKGGTIVTLDQSRPFDILLVPLPHEAYDPRITFAIAQDIHHISPSIDHCYKVTSVWLHQCTATGTLANIEYGWPDGYRDAIEFDKKCREFESLQLKDRDRYHFTVAQWKLDPGRSKAQFVKDCEEEARKQGKNAFAANIAGFLRKYATLFKFEAHEGDLAQLDLKGKGRKKNAGLSRGLAPKYGQIKGKHE